MLYRTLLIFLSLALTILAAACSTSSLSGSWKNPDYRGRIGKVYVIGVSKQDINRRLFEDQFNQSLQAQGVVGISSYKDLPSADIGQQAVAERVRANGADSVLMTRMMGKRTEEVVTPGRVTAYSSGPYGYSPNPYYRTWVSYYERRYEATYEPPTVTQYQVATIEANLYDVKSGELIWSAQLDTVVDAKLQKLIKDFVKTVVTDLKQQGLF